LLGEHLHGAFGRAEPNIFWDVCLVCRPREAEGHRRYVLGSDCSSKSILLCPDFAFLFVGLQGLQMCSLAKGGVPSLKYSRHNLTHPSLLLYLRTSVSNLHNDGNPLVERTSSINKRACQESVTTLD